MSYYTEFQVNEATLQASSTSTGATLSSSDSLLVYVNSISHPMQRSEERRVGKECRP